MNTLDTKTVKIRLMSWEDVNKACHHLSRIIKESEIKCDVIVPIIRGGLVPGTILSHFLGGSIPLVPLQWQTRDGGNRDEDHLNQILNEYNTVLFVDDLIDSGETVDQISAHIDCENNNNYFAVLKYNINSKKPINTWRMLREGRIITAATYSAEMEHCIWWEFPWETNEV